jgi:hypothetical protein
MVSPASKVTPVERVKEIVWFELVAGAEVEITSLTLVKALALAKFGIIKKYPVVKKNSPTINKVAS